MKIEVYRNIQNPFKIHWSATEIHGEHYRESCRILLVDKCSEVFWWKGWWASPNAFLPVAEPEIVGCIPGRVFRFSMSWGTNRAAYQLDAGQGKDHLRSQLSTWQNILAIACHNMVTTCLTRLDCGFFWACLPSHESSSEPMRMQVGCQVLGHSEDPYSRAQIKALIRTGCQGKDTTCHTPCWWFCSNRPSLPQTL